MRPNFYLRLLTPVIIIWVLFFGGCAGRSYLMVDYQLPETEQHLGGKIIHLEFNDQRENPAVMTFSAARKFKAFGNRYSLSYIMPDKVRIMAGEHNLSDLFKEAFEKRLRMMGAGLTDEKRPQVPVLSITLEQFSIDLKDNNWIADIDYRAVLTNEGHPVPSERIRANAQRVKVIGRKGADTVMSDIFTDALNRLDLKVLFQKSGLLP